MGHALRAIIGPRAAVAEFAGRWVKARLVPLPQDFALVPLTDALCDDIVELVNDPGPVPFAALPHLPSEVELALREGSKVGPLGCIETDYFGGVGTQGAIGWASGRVAFGPERSESSWGDDGPRTDPPGERAVNQLLAWLGVRAGGGRDEFDTLVLGRYRDTESVAAKHLSEDRP